MACKVETKTIGDHEISVRQWPAETALLNKLKLVKIFGPAFAMLAGAKKGHEVDVLSSVVDTLFQSSEPEEILAFMKACVIGVGCDGEKITTTGINDIFSGDKLTDFYKVFLFVIQVNYSNLLNGQQLKGMLAKAKEKL